MLKKNQNKGLNLWDDLSPTSSNDFGGVWTEQKLRILEKYVSFYPRALKNQKYNLIYIDSFAGTGFCNGASGRIPGSAIRALSVEPGYSKYIFIERKPRRCKLLSAALSDPAYENKNIVTKLADANLEVPALLAGIDWRYNRAVIFLDPFGMELDWTVLEAIARTRAVDGWYLFSLSGFFRQATNQFIKLDEHKTAALNRILGTNKWSEEIYGIKQQDMYGQEMRIRTANVDDLIAYATRRLKDIFPFVSEPLILPRTGVRRYALFFFTSNPSRPAIYLASKVAAEIVRTTG